MAGEEAGDWRGGGRAWVGSEDGFGDGAVSFCGTGAATGNDYGGLHFVEADVEADGSGHEDVVVCADDGSVGAVGFAFVDEVFVEASAVGLGVEVFAYDFDEGGYDHGFGGDVGVEAVFAWEALADFVFGLASGVEVGVYGGYLIEDVLGLVAAFDLAFAVVGLEGVGFYDEQGVVVPGGDLCCFPCEAVDVAVPAPLCDDCGASAFGHCEAVDDCDH